MQKKFTYDINFAGDDPRATRPYFKGTVEAATIPMAAHRAVLHAREGSGNKQQFDRVSEMFITIKEVKE